MKKNAMGLQDDQSGEPADSAAPPAPPLLEADFDQLVAAYRPRVSRLAYRLLGWDQQAQDVVQEVFLAAWLGRKSFGGRSTVWTWLAAIAIKRCRSHRRSQLRRLRLVWRMLRAKVEPAPAASAPAQERETFDRVQKAVRALPPKLAEVSVLHYLEEMPIQEVAEVLSISPNTVQVRLHRARAALKEKLADLIKEK